MQQYDKRLKSILYRSMPRLFRLLGLPPVAEFLTVEFPIRQTFFSDWVVRLLDGRILHIELQSRNDPRMLFRCLDYWRVMLERWPDADILQLVVYLGDGPMTMVSRIDRAKNHFEFDVLILKDIDAGEFLQSIAPRSGCWRCCARARTRGKRFGRSSGRGNTCPPRK